jgi:hypothetical protein
MSTVLLLLFACLALLTMNKLGITGLSLWTLLVVVGLYLSIYYLDSINDIVLNIANVIWWICAYWLSKLYASSIAQVLATIFAGIHMKLIRK